MAASSGSVGQQPCLGAAGGDVLPRAGVAGLLRYPAKGFCVLSGVRVRLLLLSIALAAATGAAECEALQRRSRRLPVSPGLPGSPNVGTSLSSWWDGPGCTVAFCAGPRTAE